MIKDRMQKRLAAKFCAAQGIVPFVEVRIVAHTGLEEAEVDITDVDVLGVEIGAGVPRRIIFDCKTAAKQSGINRALWAGGLKSLVKADKAFVIQKKDSPDTHKLVSNTFGVHLHSEETFERYASAVAPVFVKDITYLDNMDIWDQLAALDRRNPVMNDILRYSTTQAALEVSGPKGVRNALAILLKGAGELDPFKQQHRLVFATFLSGFLISLSVAIIELKEVFQFSMQKDSFEQRLRYFIWEGRENYATRRQMKAAIERARGAEPNVTFDLPEWPRFVELIRALLDAPTATTSLSLLAKEIGFRAFSKGRNQDADNYLRATFNSNNRARQFIFLAAMYLAQACRLPKQFASDFESEVNQLISQVSSESHTSSESTLRLL